MVQALLNFIYRHPLSRLKLWRSFGGYFSYQKMLRNKLMMNRAVSQLPKVSSKEHGLPIYFLTGKDFLFQTLFCIQSLEMQTDAGFKYILVDDGSLSQKNLATISEQLSNARVVTKDFIEAQLESTLPKAKFPVLHHKRKVYPHIKKLIDIHLCGFSEWKLVLDSDMLFWKEPTEIISWLKNPKLPIHMVDCIESYGYSKSLMSELSGYQIPQSLNVGIIGLKTSMIDWNKLEEWIVVMERREGTSYYLEQALSAMIFSKHKTMALDRNCYLVNPLPEQPKSTLHHYVSTSKKEYFNSEWKRILA